MSARIRANLAADGPRAAYIGASNEDPVGFCKLFIAAMELDGNIQLP